MSEEVYSVYVYKLMCNWLKINVFLRMFAERKVYNIKNNQFLRFKKITLHVSLFC
jgi:hypothetical protein